MKKVSILEARQFLEEEKGFSVDDPYIMQAIPRLLQEFANKQLVKSNIVLADVVKSVCVMCDSKKELKSENLCTDCYDSLPS